MTRLSKCLFEKLKPQLSRVINETYFNSETAKHVVASKRNSLCPQKDIAFICTELRYDGHIQIIGKRFAKLELCGLHGIQVRDLRKLDGALKSQLHGILVRPHAILLNLGMLKAIIKSDLVIFFDSLDHCERSKQHNFILQLQQKLIELSKNDKETYNTLPVELHVLEFILLEVCSSLQSEFDELQLILEKTLVNLHEVHWQKLKALLEAKRELNHFKSKVDSIKDALSELLESDSDMSEMYLSAKAVNAPRPVHSHDEVELLLEAYLKIADELSTRLEEILSNVESTEDIINIGLVGQRNELLIFELKLAMGTFAASLGSFGASIFGMNLKSYLEGNPSAFYIVLTSTLALCGLVYRCAVSRMFSLIRKHIYRK
ncbi:Magnesium transporter MRS2/LPE10 domain-containing protein [Rozella allomycis CSF55]|uniref:Magnesium transporter n=1 Tax=Rozella allomycis (strain CSF55) TaxID=988480 RepID=A0A075AN67_ROZAC|nr:Magnesium transporter MRS2/LPE10 domain-containing protein [Rozella allomycis CSF55]|eukprot:EPZ31250.1 Magnesium transporter MRS2/LPE10 domain-containing protein [Rozella allomycis CSF55]